MGPILGGWMTRSKKNGQGTDSLAIFVPNSKCIHPELPTMTNTETVATERKKGPWSSPHVGLRSGSAIYDLLFGQLT